MTRNLQMLHNSLYYYHGYLRIRYLWFDEGSVLGLRPPVLKFRIMCLEDSVISIISPSSGGSPGPV